MKLYHVSEHDLTGKTLTPRIPDNYMTKNNYEENKTPRISFATSVSGCLIGMSQNLKGKEFFVHEPEDYNVIKTKSITNKDVPDSSLTGEVWVTTDVKLKAIYKIKVGEAIEKPLKYTFGKTTAETYAWKFNKIKSLVENNTSHIDYTGKTVYYGLTDAEVKSKKVDYKHNSKYNGKGLTLSYNGLIELINDYELGDDIHYYTTIPLNHFKVIDDIYYDEKYDIVTVETPYVINVSNVHKIHKTKIKKDNINLNEYITLITL
jgi:hypothetical protein